MKNKSYKLIKKFPGSPNKLGTIAHQDENKIYNFEMFPDLWQQIDEKALSNEIGTLNGVIRTVSEQRDDARDDISASRFFSASVVFLILILSIMGLSNCYYHQFSLLASTIISGIAFICYIIKLCKF